VGERGGDVQKRKGLGGTKIKQQGPEISRLSPGGGGKGRRKEEGEQQGKSCKTGKSIGSGRITF